MPRPILIVSSWGTGVSFTGVLRHIIAALGQVPVYVLALDQAGEVREEGHVTIVPGWCEGYESRKAQLVFQAALRIRPAAVFFYFDLFAAQYHYPALQEIQKRIAPVIAYLPIDGTLCDLGPLQAIKGFSRLVFFTDPARRRFLALNSNLLDDAEQDALQARCCVIGHGVNPEHFFATVGSRPHARQRARRQAFPGRPDLEHARIVLNANQPWERKRLDLTLDGFARFIHESRSEAYLYLHLPGASREQTSALEHQASELGIHPRVLLDGKGRRSVEELNLLFNACDVGINTAMGEGWGLVSCEHGATGAAQVLPDDEQQRDIWGPAGVYAGITGIERSWACPHVEYRVVGADHVARRLGELFADEDAMRQCSHAAAARMRAPRFDWRVIEQQWAGLFQGVLGAEGVGGLP